MVPPCDKREILASWDGRIPVSCSGEYAEELGKRIRSDSCGGRGSAGAEQGCGPGHQGDRRSSPNLNRVAVLRFDFAGLGASEGDFSRQTFSRNVSDVVRVAQLMQKRSRAPRLLIGHSLGGAAVLAAAAAIEPVRAVATIGGPREPRHVQRLFESEVDKIRRQGAADVRLAARNLTITREIVDDLASHDLSCCLAELDSALLILHAPEDRVVSVGEAAKIYRAARHPKSFAA
jgi:pimeloyl-ACP methyl ester carboxylesterase